MLPLGPQRNQLQKVTPVKLHTDFPVLVGRFQLLYASTQFWFFYLWLMFRKKIHENEGRSTLSALFILTLLCTSEIKPPPFCRSLEIEALTAYWVTFCALKLSKNNSLWQLRMQLGGKSKSLSLLFVELNESSIVQYVYMVFSHYCSSPPQGCAHTDCKVTKVQAVTNFVLLNTHTTPLKALEFSKTL